MKEIEKMYEDKKILVTGGAGCIGSNLVRRLSNLGTKELVILDNLSSSYIWNVPKGDNIVFIEGDILDDEMLKRVFKKNPEYVFHLAANFANQNSVDNPATDLMVNGMGTLKVLKYAQLAGIQRFVFTSSGCGVYGLESKIPFQEHDISIKLHTPYQVTKLLGELYSNYFHSLYNLPVVIARCFNVFGPGEVPGKYRNVIPNFFFRAMHDLPLPITGNGTESRDWTYVEDIINGLLTAGVRKEAIGEAINLGSGKDTKVIDMANAINELTGNKNGLKYIEPRNWDVKKRLLASIDKAKKLLNYEPKTNFKEGLEKVYRWFVDNRENIEKSAEF